MKVLIIEDDKKIASFLEGGFREAGFVPTVRHDGDIGLDTALVHEFDVAIVDLMLPGMDGLSVITEIRKQNVNTPVIILSARASVDDRVEGLRSGGDDYMTKPFAFSELLARVHALLRRAGSLQIDAGDGCLHVGDLTLDPWSREVHHSGKSVTLHAKEFALLEFLMRNPGRIVSKTAILENVYEYSFDPQTSVVDVLVHRLRKKLGGDGDSKLIHNQRGMGYVLKNE